ncbi:MAG: sigma-70 family RNA polymerase sigma factor [Deltaproteobacteria bacterium]|nr:sigma-70 family RNA polymerase sigma factor [Deltaproteobacteria bacterium]
MSDHATLERLYREQAPAVLRRARQILHDEDEARDALQEIFLALVDRFAFEERGGTTAWFYMRTTHFCLNRLRDGKNRARLRSEHGAPLPTSAPPRGETVMIARDVLARLPVELAEVAVYYYCDEMTHDEIATLLGCSRRHVGNLLARLHLEPTAECG